MATTPDRTIAMDILNDHSTNGIDAQVLPITNRHNQIVVLNEKLPSQKVNNRVHSSMTMPLSSKLHGLIVESAKSRDQSKPVRERITMPLCNCLNEKSTKSHVSNCMQICSRHQQQHQHQRQQKQQQQQQNSNKFKRKRKQSINQRKFAQKREHLTLIYRIDAISNSTQSNRRIVPIQSTEMTAAKFRRKSPSYYHHQKQNIASTGDGVADIHIHEKSLNNSNAHETNKPNQSQIQALTPTNLQEMVFYRDKRLGNFQNIDIKNNRWQSSAIDEDDNDGDNDDDDDDDAIDEPRVLNKKIVQSNDGKNVKRKTRSIVEETAAVEAAVVEEAREIPSKQIDTMNMTKSDWQKTMLSATKDSTSIKSTVNGIFDSSNVRGGIAEIIGSPNAVASIDAVTGVDANRTTDSTASSK